MKNILDKSLISYYYNVTLLVLHEVMLLVKVHAETCVKELLPSLTVCNWMVPERKKKADNNDVKVVCFHGY